MANGFVIIKEKDWENASTDQREWWTFNTLQNVDMRLKALEKKPLYDKALAFGGGIVGGFAAILANYFFFKVMVGG
jgi:hypothetical protein